jgi:hypothetical protein
MLDGLKFWFAGDKGDARTVELTFEPSATKEQRTAIRVFLSHFLPLEWKSSTGKGTTVIRNMSYFASTRNDGFNIMPVEVLTYSRGPKPAPFEFRGTSGWTITIDMNSRDVVATR